VDSKQEEATERTYLVNPLGIGQGGATEKTSSVMSVDSRLEDAIKQIYPHTRDNDHE
jgi:hypothetical protein